MKNLIPWRQKENAAVSPWNNDWFDRIRENPFKSLVSPFSKHISGMPSVDVVEDKNEVTVKAEVPGMTEKDIDLSWQEGVLRIRGEKKNEKEEKKNGRFYRECSYGSFSRDIHLHDTVDWKKASAKYKNGVLTVKLPKTESSKKSIQITVN
jgi:HSP20 family protein